MARTDEREMMARPETINVVLDADEYPYLVQAFRVLRPQTEKEELQAASPMMAFRQREEAKKMMETISNDQNLVARGWKIQAIPAEDY
jgi:hypothetical protein